MRKSHVLWLAVPLIVGMVTASLIAQPQTGTNNPTPRFEYATLTAQSNQGQESTGPAFTVTWNAGVIDVIGSSSNSLDDARRRLSSQLGGGNDSRTNLSVLLTTVGNEGWQLVDSTQEGTEQTMIFIRRQR